MSTPPEASTGQTTPTEASSAPPRFPWPPGEQEPVVGAFADTWAEAVLRPARFFAAMPEWLSFGAALLYYLVIGILGAGIRLFWSMLLPVRATGYLDQVFPGATAGSPLAEFLASPLYLLLSLCLAAGITHLFVLILVPGHRGFGTTLRLYCFAYSPVLFGVVPIAGQLVAFVWMTVLSIIGVREVHATSGARAAAAVLLPLACALAFLALAYVLLSRAAGLLAI